MRYVKIKANFFYGLRMLITLVLFYFAAKNQVIPYVTRKFGIWKTIL